MDREALVEVSQKYESALNAFHPPGNPPALQEDPRSLTVPGVALGSVGMNMLIKELTLRGEGMMIASKPERAKALRRKFGINPRNKGT